MSGVHSIFKEFEDEIDILKLTNDELRKEVTALRLALKSHGEIVEMNAKLRAEIEELKRSINNTGPSV